jgi:hypothetical protein
MSIEFSKMLTFDIIERPSLGSPCRMSLTLRTDINPYRNNFIATTKKDECSLKALLRYWIQAGGLMSIENSEPGGRRTVKI